MFFIKFYSSYCKYSVTIIIDIILPITAVSNWVWAVNMQINIEKIAAIKRNNYALGNIPNFVLQKRLRVQIYGHQQLILIFYISNFTPFEISIIPISSIEEKYLKSEWIGPLLHVK
jgi:hypothetical protein